MIAKAELRSLRAPALLREPRTDCAILLGEMQIAARSVFDANVLVTGGATIPLGSLVLGSPRRNPPATDARQAETSRGPRGATSRQRSITTNFIEAYRGLPARINGGASPASSRASQNAEVFMKHRSSPCFVSLG